MKTRVLTWRPIVLATLGLIGLAIWYAFIDRAATIVDRDGWHLEFSYIRLACRHCTGRVEELTWQGQPVALPQPANQNIWASCPLGSLTIVGEPPRWHLQGGMPGFPERTYRESASRITGDELARGYYDCAGIPEAADKDDGPSWRKASTPVGWALVVGRQHRRWVQPARIAELEW